MDIKQLPGYENEARGYIGWSPGDDYMGGEGWRENTKYATWADWNPVGNDVDLNLVADFYFFEESRPCPSCESGYSPAAQRVADDFYDFAGRGTRWCDKITDDEFETLKAEGRAWQATVEEVNAANGNRAGRGHSHDAINRMILVEARCKRLGIDPIRCSVCDGNAYLKTGTIGLHVWMLHPRKGAARGVTVQSVSEVDVPAIKAWLCESFAAHQRHFAWALDAPVALAPALGGTD